MRQHGPRRQQRRITPALALADCDSLDSLARTLWKAIRQRRHARQLGTLVACDKDAGLVYLLPAGEPRTEAFIPKHLNWIVGSYASTPKCGAAAVPSADMLADDLKLTLRWKARKRWPLQRPLPFPVD